MNYILLVEVIQCLKEPSHQYCHLQFIETLRLFFQVIEKFPTFQIVCYKPNMLICLVHLI